MARRSRRPSECAASQRASRQRLRDGSPVCVVVSAMGDTTDDLLDLAAQVSGAAHAREVDMLLAAGEQISIAMLTMALLDLGVPAVSLTGPQAGILTDRSHGKARIIGMRADRVAAAIERGEVPIVAGFQGLSEDQDVTTLGRGGSDTTAVALAAALEASVCEIYTDVDGVYTADPRLVPSARKLAHVSYEEMLELAACGARVLMLRSVEYARRTGVRLHVRSSFGEDEGTWVFDERGGVEHAIISGIAHDTSEAKVTLLGVPDQPGVAAAVFRPLAEAAINVDMIVQNVSAEGHTDISFTLPEADLVRTEAILDGVCRRLSAAGVVSDREHRQGVADRRRHEERPRRRRRHVRGTRGRGRQHRDHLDVVDPHLLRRPSGPRRARGRRGARALRPRTRRPSVRVVPHLAPVPEPGPDEQQSHEHGERAEQAPGHRRAVEDGEDQQQSDPDRDDGGEYSDDEAPTADILHGVASHRSCRLAPD